MFCKICTHNFITFLHRLSVTETSVLEYKLFQILTFIKEEKMVYLLQVVIIYYVGLFATR